MVALALEEALADRTFAGDCGCRYRRLRLATQLCLIGYRAGGRSDSGPGDLVVNTYTGAPVTPPGKPHHTWRAQWLSAETDHCLGQKRRPAHCPDQAAKAAWDVEHRYDGRRCDN